MDFSLVWWSGLGLQTPLDFAVIPPIAPFVRACVRGYFQVGHRHAFRKQGFGERSMLDRAFSFWGS